MKEKVYDMTEKKKLVAFNDWDNIEKRVIRMSYDYRDYLSDLIKLKSPERYQSAKNILYKLFKLGIISLEYTYRYEKLVEKSLDNDKLEAMSEFNQSVVEDNKIEDTVLSEMFGKATKYGYATNDTSYFYAKKILPKKEYFSDEEASGYSRDYSMPFAIRYVLILVGFHVEPASYQEYYNSEVFKNPEYLNIVYGKYEKMNDYLISSLNNIEKE